jgi:hypothetical protein
MFPINLPDLPFQTEKVGVSHLGTPESVRVTYRGLHTAGFQTHRPELQKLNFHFESTSGDPTTSNSWPSTCDKGTYASRPALSVHASNSSLDTIYLVVTFWDTNSDKADLQKLGFGFDSTCFRGTRGGCHRVPWRLYIRMLSLALNTTLLNSLSPEGRILFLLPVNDPSSISHGFGCAVARYDGPPCYSRSSLLWA